MPRRSIERGILPAFPEEREVEACEARLAAAQTMSQFLEHASGKAVTQPSISELMALSVTGPFAAEYDPAVAAPALQIKATGGVGAMNALIKTLAASKELRDGEVHLYVANDKIAQKIAELAMAEGPRCVVVSGRSANRSSGGYCARKIVAKRAGKLEIGVYRNLCLQRVGSEVTRCRHFKNCAFINQWHDDKPALRIFPLRYALLPKPKPEGKSLPTARLNVIVGSLVPIATSDFALPIEELDGPYAAAAHDCSQSGKDLRDALIERGVIADLTKAISQTLSRQSRPSIDPTMDDEAAMKALDEVEKSANAKKAAFFRRVSEEMNIHRPFNSIELREEEVKIDGIKTLQHRVHAHELKKCHLSNNTPLLILDAAPNQELNERIFRRPIEHVEIAAERKVHVVQCSSTALSINTLRGPNPVHSPKLTPTLAKVEKIVAMEVTNGARVLVVMPHQVRTLLANLRKTEGKYVETWCGASVTHFNESVSGDEWRDFDTIIVVGRNEPSPREVDGSARAFGGDQPEHVATVGSNPFPWGLRGYRMRDGQHIGVETAIHPSMFGQLALEQIRERVSLQAIDLLDYAGPNKKRVVILCSDPLDVTVDELKTLDELAETPYRGPLARMQDALDQEGILPTGRDLVIAFPDLFPSKAVARDALRRVKSKIPNGGTNHIISLFDNSPHLRFATYRRAGKGGNASRVIVDTSRHPDPKAAIKALEALLDKSISEFEFDALGASCGESAGPITDRDESLES